MAQYVVSALVGFAGKRGELGSYAEWLCPIAGMKIRGKTIVSEADSPLRLVQEMSGIMKGRWIWVLKQDDQVVEVDFCLEYIVPGGILEKIADKLFLGTMNQKTMEKTMHGLKDYCEK
jgi:hypothetical protein